MDPKDREELCDTGPEEETTARQKKRSRRVSFAEITSVHVFDRDEYETPPDSQPDSKNSEMGEANEALGFQRDVGDSDDSKELMQNGEDDEDDDDDERRLFVRDMDLSSPGSAIGSATSNDEENFFGPVSASFIRSGQLSDSAASNDNHDITLDSTAFSMHFHSIVQSDSVENFKTSSGHHLTFEGRTPSDTSTPTNRSSFMEFTGIKKPIPHCSVSDGNPSGGCDSNDMSFVEENPHRYDYGRLSPTLDALLAEGSKNLRGNSVSNDIDIPNLSNYLNRDSRFPILDRRKSNLKDLKDSGSMKRGSIITKDTSVEVIYGASLKSCEGSGGSANLPIDQISLDCSSSSKNALPTDTSIADHNRNLCESVEGMPFDMNKVHGGDALETSGVILEVDACNNATLTPSSKTLNVNMIIERECGFLGHAGVSSGKETFDDGCLTPKTLQNSDRESGSQLAWSVSSLRAKRRQIFSNSKEVSILFARNHHSSSLKNDMRVHRDIGSSIEKSISKFEILDTPATVEDGVDNLKPTFFDHNCKLDSETAVSENSENLTLKQVDISVTGLEAHLLSGAQKNNDLFTTDVYQNDKYKNISMLRQAEKYVSVVHDGACREQISTNMLYGDQPSEAVTPFQFSGSGKQMQKDPLASHNPTGGAFTTFGSDLLLTAVPEDANENKQTNVTSNQFSASLERIGILSRALKQQDQGNKLVSSSSGQDNSAVIDATVSHLTPDTRKDVSYLTPIAGRVGSLLKEKISQSTSPIIGNNCRDPINVVKLKGMGDNQLFHDLQKESGNIMYCKNPLQHRVTLSNARDPRNIVKLEGRGDNKLHHELQNESGNITDCKTPLRDKVTLHSQSGSLVRNYQAWKDLSKCKELSEREPAESLYESASPSVLERVKTTPSEKQVLVDQMAQTPSMKEASNFLDNDKMQLSVGKDPLSPTFLKYSNGNSHGGFHQDLHILEKPLSVFDVDNSGRKRKSEVILTENFQVEETGRTQKSPKVFEINGIVPEFSSEHLIVRDSNVDSNQADRVRKLSSDVFLKLYGAMRQLLSESRFKLNLLQLGIVEDFLGQLQKAKKYQNLCTVIQLQKSHGHLGNFQQKRVAEARSLQQMFVYEQAKLQLMRVKHEILQKRVRLLQSGIRESQNLKLCVLHHLSVPGVRGAEIKGTNLTLLSLDERNEEACNKVFTMKLEIGDLGRKIKSIIEYFHDSCHIKGELSYDETEALVNNILKKRTCCSFIRQDLQLWSVDDLQSESGSHNVVLNYHNFLFQRFMITVRPISSVVTLNKLNDANIIKAFPNINASPAFKFMFNADGTNKRSGLQCLAEETQIVSSLLGNLLDVIEEVQAAFIKLPDLIHTSFHSPCVEELNLHLCFIHFKTGMKVILILDMTYLNRGLYPSDVIPSFVSTEFDGVGTPMSPPLSVSSEIKVAVEKLKGGHSRITRLCRCVSQVVQALSSWKLPTSL